jgi:molybdenum cofactor cytidylyltransferase
VVLAAGTSKRLGQPKQLLEYKGRSLLQHSVEAAEKTGIKHILVVVGANNLLMENEMKGYNVQIIFNEHWPEGMASSIRCGLTEMKKRYPDTDGVLFLVCDQPFVTGRLLNELMEKQKEKDSPLAACVYAGIAGTPALFHKEIFPDLMELNGDTGARKIIQQYRENIAELSFDSGLTDIDTMSDYENLLKMI